MSSPDKVSVPKANVGPEGGEHADDRLVSPEVSQGLVHGPVPGPQASGERESGPPGPESCDLETGQLDTTEAGEGVHGDPEGQTSSPADQEESGLDLLPQLSVQAVAIMQELTNLQKRPVRRYPSPRTCVAELSAIWGIGRASPNKKESRPPSCVKGKQVPTISTRARGPGRGRASVTPRRGTTSTMTTTEEGQQPSTEPEPLEGVSGVPVMRVTISLKEKHQAKSSGPMGRGDTTRQPNVHARDNLAQMSASLLTTAPRGLTSAAEKQASGEPEGFFYKKMQTVVLGKEISRPSYQGGATAATAAAPAAAGSLPKASPRKKPVKEKKPVYDASRVTLGRSFPSWGQRLRSAPVEPANFPPVSGVALLGRASRCSLSSSGPKQCKPCSTVKKSVGRRTKGSQPTARDDETSRDPGPQAQREEQPGVCMHPNEFRIGDSNIRALQASRNLALSEKGTRSIAHASSGDQEPSVHTHLPGPERQEHPLGVQGCPRCLVLQKEIHDLKEQLAETKALAEKLQAL